MRYLYGDSSPFPLQYNFLAMLEVFVDCAARAAGAQWEINALIEKNTRASAERDKTLAELDAFHRTVMQSLHVAMARAGNARTTEYAAQLTTYANGLVDDARRGAAQSSERDQQRARSDNDARRTEMRAALEKFLTVARFPTLESKITMTLENGHHVVSAEIANPDGLRTAFTLGAENIAAWQSPRKVSDFAHGLNWQVGTRKSWIKRTPEPDMVQIDEFVIGGFELADDVAEIRLRKRADMPDSLIFRVAREDEGLVTEVERPGIESGDDALPAMQDPRERSELEQLWLLIRAGITEALSHKTKLLWARLDDRDVFENDLVIELVQRIVKLFSPTVAEIAKRSPNTTELSLKSESDAGRREEIYLKKADLAKKLAPLAPVPRNAFGPLGLMGELVLADSDILVDD